MMKKQNKKRGFTIVELTIVVSVIAILSAVMIPTFAAIIKRSKISADEQAVRNMNTVIATITDDEIDYNTMADALDENGFNVLNKNDAWNPVYKEHKAYWVPATNKIILVKDGETVPAGAMELKASNYVATSNATTAEAVVADIKTAINNGNSITLTESVDMSSVNAIQIPEDAELTIDFAGSTLTTAERNPGVDHQYGFQVSGNLTIKNATINARGVEVYDGGVLTLEDATIDAVDANGGAAVYVWNGGKAVINGGTYTNSQANNTAMAGATAVISFGDLTINGGTFTSTAGVYAIVIKGGTASINNATITGARGGIAVEAGTATIKNCTVTSNWTTDASCYALYVAKGANVTESNNTFTSANGNHIYRA